MSDTTTLQTAAHIRKELEIHRCDHLRLLALADMAEDAGEQDEANELHAAARYAEDVGMLSALKRSLVLNHEMQIQRIEMDLAAARKKCPHPVTKTYTGSGNNDNEEECLCCGKMLR